MKVKDQVKIGLKHEKKMEKREIQEKIFEQFELKKGRR